MATQKTVQFQVETKNLTITSGTYQVWGIVNGYAGAVNGSTSFSGNTFSQSIKEDESEYYAVTVYIKSYQTANGTEVTVNDDINLMATLYLTDADYTVKITPGSTIASIYTFAQMMNVDRYEGNWMEGTQRHAKIAYGMKQNLYKTEGGIADMIKSSPNAFETNSYPMFNSLCNIFYYCLTDSSTSSGTSFYQQFLQYAWHKEGAPNTNFIQAVRNMIYDPFCSAKEIYHMIADREEVYEDSLTSMKVPDSEKAPDQWTLTLKTNQSGAKNFIPSGLAYVVFDKEDKAWIANNFRAGTGFSGTHCLVYNHDATPADFSPVQGGGLLGVGFGAAIDPSKEYISFGNFGWGPEFNNPQQGGIARFHYKDGKPESPSNGYTLGLSRVQGMAYDNDGNLWMASVGCQDPFAPAPTGVYPFTSEPSAVVVYLNGVESEETMLIRNVFPIKKSFDSEAKDDTSPYLKVFDVVPDNKGGAYISCIGTYDEDEDKCALSAVYQVAIEDSEIVVKNHWFSDYYSERNDNRGFESLRQVTINGDGDVVVVGVTGSRATILSPDLSEVKGYYDTNVNAPWGVKIDKQQSVYLANFGREKERKGENTLDMQGPFGVTLLRDPSKPETARLMTVPTGGDEVMLANGHPLYGTQTRPVAPHTRLEPIQLHCYQPIMRLTSTNIDGAGNLWCMNNWKPSAIVDVKDNPGGDGAVIFLGIAAPE